MKAYNELVGKIKKAYLNAQTDSTKAVLEDILPELKELKDERIRKTLIEYFNAYPKDYYGELKKSHILAWLKKQESVGEIVERCKTSWYNEGKIQGQIEGLSDEEKYQQGWHDALEEQGEQKPAWSEEDEKFFKTALWHISYSISNGKSTDIHCDTTDWLKSLKERYTWKPSEEQIEILDMVLTNESMDDNIARILRELIGQLKKLREE